MKIKVSLLGTPKVIADGKVINFPYKRSEGLFYYLCVKGSVIRDEIISVFWADSSLETARKNLRDALYHIKRVLGNDIIVSRGNNRIEVRQEALAPIDYLTISDRNIVEKYTDEFLGFFYISNCLEFEDWVHGVRTDLDTRFLNAIRLRDEEAALRGDSRTISNLGQTLITRKKYDEKILRKLMSDLKDLSCYDDALELYRDFSSSLRRDMDDSPEELTEDLAAEIKELKIREAGNKRNEGERFYLRDKEMLAIMEELYLFRTGVAADSILLEGEAGVGKTAILENLSNSSFLDEYSVVTYRCVEDEKELLLKPWKDMINALSGIAGEEWEIPVYDSSLQLEAEDTGDVFDAQCELCAETLIERLSQDPEKGKVIFIIDDIQWMDNASLRILKNLLLWSRNRMMLAFMAVRSEEAGNVREIIGSLSERGLLRRTEVNCFSAEEVGIIIRNQMPDILDKSGALNEIYQTTGGNALFLFEYLKEIRRDRSAAVSQKITDAIQRRLSGLDEDEKFILRCISLQPRFATMEELRAMMDGRDVTRIVDSLLARQILKPEHTYIRHGFGFPHQIIKDHVYDRIPSEERKRLHLKLAEYEESEYFRTGDVGSIPVLIHNFREGGDLFRFYQYQLEYLSMFYSIEHEIYPTVLAKVTVNQLPQLESDDQLVNLVEKIRALHKEHPEAAPLRMRAEFMIGRYDLFSGSLKKGIENIHFSIMLAKELGDSQCLLDNYLQMAYYTIQIHNMVMFNDYLESCENLITKGGFSEADVLTVKRLRGLYYMKTGDRKSAKNIFAQVISSTEDLHKDDIAYQIGLAACYNYLGEICETEGEMETALRNYMLAISSLEQSELMNTKGAVIYTNAGYLLYRMGRNSQASIYIRKGIRCYEDNSGIWGRSKAYSCAALLAIENGHWEEAMEMYGEAKADAIRDENPDSMEMIKRIEKLMNDKEGGE